MAYQFPPIEDINDAFAEPDEENHAPLDSEICNYCGQLFNELNDEGACEDCALEVSEPLDY